MSRLNHEVLETLKETLGDDDFFEVMNTFVRQFESQLQEIMRHAERCELSDCARILHSLKGGAGNIGAVALAEIANSFEQRARTGDVSMLPAMTETLSNTILDSIDEMRTFGYLGALN